jgi:DNA-binding NtrC family response regulator
MISKEQGIENKNFTKEALVKLNKYEWTGNVRELRNVIERLMILGDNPVSEDNIIQFASK